MDRPGTLAGCARDAKGADQDLVAEVAGVIQELEDVGLAVGDVVKPILRFAGITDAWGYTDGHTKTTVNYAQAAYRALSDLSRLKVPDADATRLKIVRGGTGTSILPPKEDTPRPTRGGPGGRRGPSRGRGGPQGRGGPGARGGGPGRRGPPPAVPSGGGGGG